MLVDQLPAKRGESSCHPVMQLALACGFRNEAASEQNAGTRAITAVWYDVNCAVIPPMPAMALDRIVPTTSIYAKI